MDSGIMIELINFFYICLSGRNKTELEFIETKGIICRTECATLGDTPTED
jgi:hypothetical protein